MKKTISQAEKRKNHALRLEQERIEREQENKERAETAIRQLKVVTELQIERPLSKKEQRQLAKKQASEVQVSTMQKEHQSHVDIGSSSKTFEIQAQEDILVKPTSDKCDYKEVIKDFTSIEDKIENLSIEEDNAKIIAKDPIRLHGLLPVVARLEKELIGCKIILGWSYISKDSIENFELRVQAPKVEDDSIAREGVVDSAIPELPRMLWCIAREGTGNKDIFINDYIGYLTEESLQDKINKILEEKFEKQEEHQKSDDSTNPSTHNRSLHFQLSTAWKEQHQAKVEKIKAQEKQAEMEKRISERTKKLKSKVTHDSIQEYAMRDEDIVNGKIRTKNSMR